MNKHTKGPWEYGSEYRLEDYDFCVYGQINGLGARTVVADICDHEESEANARLIAAAPLMYELLAMKSASGDDDCRRLLAEIGDV